MIWQLPRNSTAWQLAGTDTFRRGSRKIFNSWGGNLQNPTKDICKIYEADEGKLLAQVDQSGAEALVVAYLVRHGNFRDLFLNKIKSHVYVGLHLFADEWKQQAELPMDEYLSCPIPELKNMPGWKRIEKAIKDSDHNPPSRRYYFMAKQVCHSSNYGIQANSLRVNVLQKSDGKVALTQKQAEHFLDVYHKLFPELREWHRETENILRRTRTLRNLFGYPRTFYGAMNEEFFKSAYAFVPQSTVGIITAIAFTLLQEYIEDNHLNWDILNDKHDSYLVQAPAEAIKDAAAKMQEFMNQDLVTPSGVKFKMKSSASIGKNWGPYDETDNPEGLKEQE